MESSINNRKNWQESGQEYWFFLFFFCLLIFFFVSNRCFLSFFPERGRVWVKGIVPPVFNLCSIDEGFHNPLAAWFPSGLTAGGLECMVLWGKGTRGWAECLAGLPWPWIKHHKAQGGGGEGRGGGGNHNLWLSRREKKTKRIGIITLGTISSGISTVTARPVYSSVVMISLFKMQLLKKHISKADTSHCCF